MQTQHREQGAHRLAGEAAAGGRECGSQGSPAQANRTAASAIETGGCWSHAGVKASRTGGSTAAEEISAAGSHAVLRFTTHLRIQRRTARGQVEAPAAQAKASQQPPQPDKRGNGIWCCAQAVVGSLVLNDQGLVSGLTCPTILKSSLPPSGLRGSCPFPAHSLRDLLPVDACVQYPTNVCVSAYVGRLVSQRPCQLSDLANRQTGHPFLWVLYSADLMMLGAAVSSSEVQLQNLARSVLQHPATQLQQRRTTAHARSQTTAAAARRQRHFQRGGRQHTDSFVCTARRSSVAQQLKELRDEGSVEKEAELPPGALAAHVERKVRCLHYCFNFRVDHQFLKSVATHPSGASW